MKKILLAILLLSASFGILGSCLKAAAVVANNCDTYAQKVADAGNAFLPTLPINLNVRHI